MEFNVKDNWTKGSWRNKPIIQVPDYDDQEHLNDVEKRLSSYPPLVFAAQAPALPTAPLIILPILPNLSNIYSP